MIRQKSEGSIPEAFEIIDFEASSLDENSYPIEVGLAVAGAGAIESWSSLIRPTREWVKRDAWSRSSAKVHGITKDMLSEAPFPAVVMPELNKWLSEFAAVYCDGGSYDKHWLTELCAAAGGMQPMFRLADVSLLVGPDPQRCAQYVELMRASKAPTALRQMQRGSPM